MQSYALTTIEEPSFHEGKHILFVDDELLLVEMTKRMLERIGCRVTALTDGSGGLKVFTENPDSFDLDVADQTMSDMTGIAFAKDSLAVRKHMPVILCIGDGEIASQESACGVGIRGFVIMPVTKKAMARYYAEQIHKVLNPVGSPARLQTTVEDIAEHNPAEKTQKEAEEKYRNIFENAMEGIFQSEPDGFSLSANPALARIFGYASAEELLTTVRDIGGQLHAQRESLGRLVEERHSINAFEFEGCGKDGRKIWVSVNARAVRSKGGEVLRYEGAIQDVTARKEAEQSLRTSQLQLSQAMDLADIVYWEGDPESKEGAFNDPFYALFATTAEREGGYRMMMDDYAARFVHPGDLEFFHRSVGEAIADSSRVDSVRLEHRGIRRDGRIIHVVTKVKSIRDVSGRAIRFYGVTQDITARREAEEALRESEEKYRGIFENAVEGIFQSTPDFKSVNVNPALARMRGYDTPGELKEAVAAGRDEIFLSRADKARYACLLKKHGMLKGFETELRRKDGSAFLASVNTQAVKDAEGNVVCYEGIIEDITGRRKLEGQLRQTRKMEAIGTLSAGIAHDFNNMLAIVMGNAELAMDDVANGDNPEHNLDQILKAAKRGRDLVKQILTFSRKTQRERRPTDVVPVLRETFKLLRSTLPSTVKMSLDVKSKSAVILGDSVQVEQVLMNLATNAAHAMSKAGGTLAIRLADAAFHLTDSLPEPDMKLGDYLMLIFEDTGTGMTEAVRDRIFDPFFTTKKSGQGTGMGLSVVYGIVKSYSGAITVESAPGKGSTFTIYLPKAESRTGKQKDAAQVVQGNNERVLFVDDEPALAEIAASMLERLSYRVTAVTDGKEALSLFLENPYAFDLVITDQTMPDITGIALAREMMRIRPDVPIMLCTGYSEMVSPEKAKKAGMREFLTKPLVKAELAQAIRRALDEGDGGK